MVKFCIILLVVGIMLLALIKPLKILMGSQRKKVLIYYLLLILFFSLTGILTIEKLLDTSLVFNYILMHIIIFSASILHLYTMENFIEWPEENKNTVQLLFTLVGTILGSAGFLYVSGRFGTPSFPFYLWSAFISFFIIFFVRLLWICTIKFPEPIFIKWYYPINRTVTIPDREELRNPRIISLLLLKNSRTDIITIFKAKAPEHMTFDKFFFHFINDYNLRTPESQIEVKDGSNQPYGWYFYTKPNFFGVSRNINPHLTIHANMINENTAIVCKRAL